MDLPNWLRPDRHDRRALPKRILVAATVVTTLSLVFMGVILMLNVPGEFGSTSNGFVEYRAVGEDYVAVRDLFWEGKYAVGGWRVGDLPTPDRIQVVAGSDVARILAGGEPIMVYGTFEPWSHSDHGGIGDFELRVPAFTCTGPSGNCEPGDLPALVLARGDAWHGVARANLDRGTDVASVVVDYQSPIVLPVMIGSVVVATVGIAVGIGAAVAWGVTSRRAPASTAPAPAIQSDTESMLRMASLAQLQISSIMRQFVINAVLLVAGFLTIEFLLVPMIVDGSLEGQTSKTWILIWGTLAYWWGVPWTLGVAAAFWGSQLRVALAEREHWNMFSRRLAGIERAVLD